MLNHQMFPLSPLRKSVRMRYLAHLQISVNSVTFLKTFFYHCYPYSYLALLVSWPKSNSSVVKNLSTLWICSFSHSIYSTQYFPIFYTICCGKNYLFKDECLQALVNSITLTPIFTFNSSPNLHLDFLTVSVFPSKKNFFNNHKTPLSMKKSVFTKAYRTSV